MNRFLTVGISVLAGAALFEVALVPAVVIGGAAMLAPALLPKLRRGLRPAVDAITRPLTNHPASPPNRPEAEGSSAVPGKFAVKRALAKTVTFRLIVTTLDFTTNYIVIGELATAAGLSTFSLVAGPVFYFAHEAAWNYLGPPTGAGVCVSAPPWFQQKMEAPPSDRRQIVISRPLAKTITFRTIATVMDFTTNFVVIGDIATAAGLSAFGFVLGPFIYLGHEAAWDYYGPSRESLATPPPLIQPATVA